MGEPRDECAAESETSSNTSQETGSFLENPASETDARQPRSRRAHIVQLALFPVAGFLLAAFFQGLGLGYNGAMSAACASAVAVMAFVGWLSSRAASRWFAVEALLLFNGGLEIGEVALAALEGGTVTFTIADAWLFLLFTAAQTGVAYGLRALLLAWASQRRPGCCPTCGYDLTGNVSGRCPECGTRMAHQRKPAC